MKKQKKQKGELTQQDVINKVVNGEVEVYTAYVGMQSHFGHRSVSHFTIEMHPTKRLLLQTGKATGDFCLPIDLDGFPRSTTVLLFDRSWARVVDLDTNKEIDEDEYKEYFEVLKYFETKKDADIYFLKEFSKFF